MCRLFKRLFNKRKAQKLNTYISNLEEGFTLLETVEQEDVKMSKIVRVLSMDENYFDLVSRYRVCVQKISQHNDTIKSLIFACNSLLKRYPIPAILEGVEAFSVDKLLDFQSTINEVFEYKIPHSFKRKNEYCSYENELSDIIENLDIIKEQKALLRSIDEEIRHLPDKFIVVVV